MWVINLCNSSNYTLLSYVILYFTMLFIALFLSRPKQPEVYLKCSFRAPIVLLEVGCYCFTGGEMTNGGTKFQ